MSVQDQSGQYEIPVEAVMAAYDQRIAALTRENVVLSARDSALRQENSELRERIRNLEMELEASKNTAAS